jgi:hypothetical protein
MANKISLHVRSEPGDKVLRAPGPIEIGYFEMRFSPIQ